MFKKLQNNFKYNHINLNLESEQNKSTFAAVVAQTTMFGYRLLFRMILCKNMNWSTSVRLLQLTTNYIILPQKQHFSGLQIQAYRNYK